MDKRGGTFKERVLTELLRFVIKEHYGARLLELQIKVVKITPDDRIILEEPKGINIGPDMIAIERRMQELTKLPIDLRLEPRDDRNKREARNELGI